MIRKLLILLLTGLVRGYQLVVSPWFAPTCRYYPTCSTYAIDALRIHGPIKGLYLATWRLLRCNPWSKGGVDPVAPKKSSRGSVSGSAAGNPPGSAANFHSPTVAGSERKTPRVASPSWSTLHGNL